MKKLIIVRHAKSDWTQNKIDHDRPLKPNGIDRAMKHADLLYHHLDFIPEYWASSFAIRALHTAKIFAEKFDCVNNLKVNKNLYTFSYLDLKCYIEKIPSVIDSAIIFGHNDACIDFVNETTSANLKKFKTASCAILEYKLNRWCDIDDGNMLSLISRNKIQ